MAQAELLTNVLDELPEDCHWTNNELCGSSYTQAARTEGLMARAELLTNALDELGHRLADAQSLAASQCEPVSLQEKVCCSCSMCSKSLADGRIFPQQPRATSGNTLPNL